MCDCGYESIYVVINVVMHVDNILTNEQCHYKQFHQHFCEHFYININV